MRAGGRRRHCGEPCTGDASTTELVRLHEEQLGASHWAAVSSGAGTAAVPALGRQENTALGTWHWGQSVSKGDRGVGWASVTDGREILHHYRHVIASHHGNVVALCAHACVLVGTSTMGFLIFNAVDGACGGCTPLHTVTPSNPWGLLWGSIRTARAPRVHRARTASAPRQVFEQLPSEMVYWERSCKWYLVGS